MSTKLGRLHEVIFACLCLCSLQVIVTVLDDNDHSPVFTRSNYDFRVAENVDIGHLVGTVTASDEDKGINAKISFLISAEDGGECLKPKIQEWNRDIVLCSWARHFALTVPLSTQGYKWVPANLILGVTLRWTSIPSRRELKYS